MNILFGEPQWEDWIDSINSLSYKVFFNDLNNINIIINLIIKHKINILVPCTFNQMFFIINNHDILSQHVKHIMCGNNIKAIKLLNNKIDFSVFMEENKFNEYIPTTFWRKQRKIQVKCQPLRYPCIFKFAEKYGGDGAMVIKSVYDIHLIYENYDNYIIQEYISSSNEYSGNFYIANDIIKYAIFYMMTNNNKYHIQCGKMEKYTKIKDNGLDFCLDIFTEIFKKLNYNGCACVDFKIYNNKLKIFEINPRFGGTLINNKDDLNKLITSCIN